MSKYYLDNKRFEELIVLYLKYDKKKRKKGPNPHENELMALFDILIGTILESFKFDVDLDDAKQECFLLIIKKLKNFDPNHGSAFNYFTTVILNNLRLVYTKRKKYDKKIADLFEIRKDSSVIVLVNPESPKNSRR
jgi:DNA-directed RNA polymerase specialized sigma24 family protein